MRPDVDVSTKLFNEVDNLLFHYEQKRLTEEVPEDQLKMPRDQMQSKIDGDIEQILGDIKTLIDDGVAFIDENYENCGLPLKEIIQRLDEDHKKFISDQIILSISKKLIGALENKRIQEAMTILDLYPYIIHTLLSLRNQPEKNLLIKSLIPELDDLSNLASITQQKKEVLYSKEYIILSHLGLISFKDLVETDINFLEKILMTTIGKLIFELNIPANKLFELYNKQFFIDSHSIITTGIKSEQDLDAWNSLTVNEFTEIMQIPCMYLEKANISNWQIIGIFKQSPKELRDLCTANISEMLAEEIISLDSLRRLYAKDIEKFKFFTTPIAIRYISSKGLERFEEFYDNDPIKCRMYLSPQMKQISGAIGPEKARNLYLYNTEAFMAVYNLGESFLVQNKNNISKLVTIYDYNINWRTLFQQEVNKINNTNMIHQKLK